MYLVQIFVVVLSLCHVRLFVTGWTAARQASLSSRSPEVCSNSCALSQWCHPTISSSATLFFYNLQSFPESESFPVSRLFATGAQSIGVLASVLPMTIQGWFPLGWTGLILQSKELSRVFSSTVVQKYQYFCTQPLYAPHLPGALSQSYLKCCLPGCSDIYVSFQFIHTERKKWKCVEV